MQTGKKSELIQLNVVGELNVAVAQHVAHEFLMPTKQVALGYGVSPSTIRSHLNLRKQELKLGQHYLKGVQVLDIIKGVQPHEIIFTKAGVVRLGFFIKSERARLFRDWAEKVVLNALEKPIKKDLKSKRKHNRITESRLVELLADVAQIKDHALRMSLVNKLTSY